MKKILSILFLALLGILFVGTMKTAVLTEILPIWQGYGGGIKGLILTAMDTGSVSAALNRGVVFHDRWIDLYGASLRASGVDVLHEDDGKVIARQQDGSVAFVYDNQDAFNAEQSDGVAALYDAAKASGSRCIFVTVPRKTCSREPGYAARGLHTFTEETDAYRKAFFAAAGYETLDLHEWMHEAGLNHHSAYFRTDHHWKPETALRAAGEIARALGIDAAPLDAGQFTEESYPGLFLGSEGKHVGRLYAGTDDLVIPIPQFETHLTLTTSGEDKRSGSFADAVLYRDYLQAGDPYHKNPYGAFLNSDHALQTLTNESLPGGMRVLLVKDSYMNACAPYLSLVCGQVDLIDPRKFSGSVPDAVQAGGYDAVLVLISSQTGSSTFDFRHPQSTEE